MTDTVQPLLKLNRFCGQELHPVTKAIWNIYYDEDLNMQNLCIYLDADYGTVLNEDTKDLAAHPNWELNYLAKDMTKESLCSGFKFIIPEGYNEDNGGWITNFYYCEHEGTDNNTIEILDRKEGKLLIRLTGETIDVNYYDGSKPNTKLFVETWFSYDESAMRSME